MPEWTGEQLAVISSGADRIICSAAAGSGKTTVMVERIIRLLEKNEDPESFLVVTFTNAAASEMKQKIRNRLREGRENRILRNALEKIDYMEICTIHSFCQRLIRQEFQAADADPFFAVCDQARSRVLFSEAFRTACAGLQKSKDPDYFYWKKCYSGKSTEEIIRAVYSFMMSMPDPYEWLERSCDRIPLRIDPEHPWFETASEMVREKVMAAKIILRRQFEMFSEPEHGEAYREVWKADSRLFHVKQLWSEGLDVGEEELAAGFIRLPKWTAVNSLEEDWKERYRKLRENLKSAAGEIDFLIRMDQETIERDFGNMLRCLQGLKKITRLTAENFSGKKTKLRVLDFNDLEHTALKILRSETAGPAVRRRWSNVFVDECQDVSRVQDEIIQRLSSGEDGAAEGRLLMVGDVKQSIYRFRLADPQLFLERRNEYSRQDSGGVRLDLQTNFRSRPEILETVNTVFRDIMRAETAEMDYSREEELVQGLPAEGFFPVRVDIAEPDPSRTKLETAADDVTVRISELRKEKFAFRDIVILMPRVSGDGKKLADLLEKRGIPVFFDGGTDFYERTEIAVFLQLLALIDNPLSDEPLITVLKSAPFFFSEEELAQIRLKKPGRNVPFRRAFEACLKEEGPLGIRCREADEKIRNWRKLASVTRMSAFIRFLCSDSHQMAMAGLSPAGNTAKKNMQMLCSQAEEAERAGIHTLHRFLEYVSGLAGSGDQRAATPLAEGDDVVRIMTMHKSKGLQFPVVFCLGLDGSLSGRPEGNVLLHSELGICLKYKRPEVRVIRDTAASAIFAWKKEREQMAEKIRLLYVAMTRAQKRMFLVGVSEKRPLWTAPAGPYRVSAAGDYLDWIMPALQDAEKLYTGFPQKEKPWNIRFSAVDPQETVDIEKSYPHLGTWLDSLLSAPPVDGLWKDLHQEPLLSGMQKKSVTSLLRKAEREIGGEEEETAEGKRIPDRFSAALRRNEAGPYPAFMMPPEEKRGAWRGTVTHRFLSLTDPARIRDAGENLLQVLRDMKEEMVAAAVFTEEEGAAVSPEDAAAFYGSGLGRRMLAGSSLHREWGFNLYLPDRNMMVQGVVDCAFMEENGWILLDYKTDRVEDEEAFVGTYRPQLEWYSEAVRELTGKPVREAWLYSLSRREAYRV